MGFFIAEEDLPAAAPKRVKANTATDIRKTFKSGGIGCDNCTLKQVWPSILSARMPISGNLKDPDVLVLGGQTGLFDDQKRKQFAHDPKDPESFNKLLHDAIPKRDLDRIAYQNLIRCYNGREAAGQMANAHACQIHLSAELEQLPIKHILGVGDIPLQYFAPGQSITEVYGTRIPIKLQDKTYWYWPIFDPFYVASKKRKFDDGQVAPVFRADIRKFFADCDKWGNPVVHSFSGKDVLLPQSLDEALDLLDQMEDPLGVDIESNQKLKPMMIGARITTAAFSDGKITFAFPIDHEEGKTDWGLELLLTVVATRPWIAHNAGFEYLWFLYFAKKLGMSTDFAPLHDTQALARCYHNRETIAGLDIVSLVHLGIDIKTLSNVVASRINDFPLSEILPYNGLDALASALVYRKPYMQRIAANDSNYARFNEAAISTAYMELMGLPVDLTASAELRAQWQTASQDAVRDVPHIYEVRKFEEERQKEFNLASSRDVGDALAIYGKIPLPRTAQQYSTSDETLQKLCPEHPLAKAVLAGRSADKMISTYIEPCEQVPSLYYDGMLHPGYTALLTATTRLSSNGPNIQNFPKRKHKELRRQVVPPLGHIFLAFDYGQLEARLIAMASKDRNLCKFILDGFDIHSKWLNNCLDIYPEYLDTLAVEVNQTDPKKIRKYGRDIIKTHFVFSSFFGSGVDSIARTTQIPKHLVERLQGSFWKEFDGVKRWIKQQRQLYANEGSTRFMIGLERHAVLWGNEPINNPIQSCAAVLVVESMNELSRLARSTGDMNWHPRINIHDDLIFCLPDDERMDPYIERIMEIMVKVRFDWQIVPLMVEARCGYSWDDLEEFTTHTGDYVR